MAESGCLRDMQVNNLDVTGTLSTKVPVYSITGATYTVKAGQSGALFALNKADGITITLPAPASGLCFDFVVATAPTTAATVVTNGSANIIHGQIVTSADGTATTTAASSDTVTFAANTAIIGDRISLVSDGTSYFVTGFCAAAAGVTTSQAS